MAHMPLAKGLLTLFVTALICSCSSEPAPFSTHEVTPAISTEQPSSEKAAPPKPARPKQDYSQTGLEVLDISERSYDGGAALAVTFSAPLNPADNYSGYFVVTHDNEGILEGSWVLSDSGKIAYFPDVEPDSSYRVQVHAGLRATNGKSLTDSSSAKVKTREMPAAISFASRGTFLPLGLHSGLPIMSVNVPEVDVDFHRVNPDKLSQFLHYLSDGPSTTYSYYADQLAKMSELVHSARYHLDIPRNKRRELNLPVQNIKALREPGVYLAIMQQPGRYTGRMQATYFAVTDLGLHLRVYGDHLDAYVASLKSGKPIGGVEISLLNKQGKITETTQSSPEGQARLSLTNSAQLVLARHGKSISLVKLTGPALDLSEFDLGGRSQRQQELFIYAPRDLYRPGETVQLSALLRDADGQLTQSPPLKAQIKSADDQLAREFTWAATQVGYYSYQYQIPDNAKTGTWTLRVTGADRTPFEYSFKVEDFLPERMKLSYNDGQPTPQFHPADNAVEVSVLGEYLYGAPAAGNRFEATAHFSAARSPLEQLPNFQFGDIREKVPQEIELPEVELDANGKTTLSIASQWRTARSPLRLTITGSLYESGGRPVSRRHQEIIWPGNTHIGIRPSFGEDNPKHNSLVSFDIVRANQHGELLAAEELDVTLIREDRRYFWQFSPQNGWQQEYTDRHYAEYTGTLAIEEGNYAELSVPVEWGYYRLEVRDPGNNRLSSIRFHAGANWYSRWARNQSAEQAARPDQVTLALDKQAYRAGDTARLSIMPPAAGEALVLVEADRKLWQKRLSVPASGVELEIPIDPEWQRHDLYISVVHLQSANRREKVTPHRAFGLIHLPLDRQPRQLKVAFDLPDKSLPNRKLPAKIRVTGQHGNAPEGETWLTLAAVDVGVLNITDFQTPDPHGHFFAQRRYQVDSRDMYQRLIELNDNPLARQRFGGDADLSRGGKEARADVQIVSLFNGPVKLAADGSAEIPLELPDFNGKLRIMAVAFSASEFGSSDSEITVAAPVVTQLAMPRFLAPGDQSMLSLDLHNLSGTEQQLHVALTTTGSIKTTQKAKTLHLKDGEKTTLRYPVTASYPIRNSGVHLSVTGLTDYQIKRSWKLALRPPYPAELTSHKVVLESGESKLVDDVTLSHLISDSLEANISISNKVDLGIRDHLQWLLRYPYGCLEQVTSTTYPWLYVDEAAMRTFGITVPEGVNQYRSLERGMDGIASRQLYNGGFGLWNNQSPENKWLTAYVGDFLTQARKQGFAVGEELYQKALKRLEDYIRNRDGRFTEHYISSANHYQLAYRAYAGFVLSQLQRAPLGSLRTLVRQHQNAKPHSMLPLIHLGLALINQGDLPAGEKLLQQAVELEYERGYYADYGSEIRDLAQSIYLLLRDRGASRQTKELSVKLADLLRQRRYLSTQERNALFLAAREMDNTSAGKWRAELILSGEKQTLQSENTLYRKLTSKEAATGFGVTNTSDEALYVRLNYQGYGKQAPQPVSNQLHIERHYYDRTGAPLDPSTLTVGDLVLVQLIVSSKRRTPDLLVVDMLPAGLELENQNLEHAIRLDTLTLNGNPVRKMLTQDQIQHEEYRDDRYIAALDLRGTAHLLYLVRAVTPGEYQVPPPQAEDMYSPEIRAIGSTIPRISIQEQP